MKKSIYILLFVFFSILSLQAETSIEKIYDRLKQLSADENLLLSHRDSAAVLSSVWELSRNFTIEDFLLGENNEWQRTKASGVFNAAIVDREIFLTLDIIVNNEQVCISLSPLHFGLTTISSSKLQTAPQISLRQKNPSSRLIATREIYPQVINQTTYTVKNPMELLFLKQLNFDVLGISPQEDGFAQIFIDGKITFDGKMQKGKIYPLPSLGSEEVFHFTLNTLPTNSFFPIFNVHYIITPPSQKNSAAVSLQQRTRGETQILEQEVQLSSQVPFARVTLPKNFDELVSVETQIISGDQDINITSRFLPLPPFSDKEVFLLAQGKDNFDIKAKAQITFIAATTKEVVREFTINNKTGSSIELDFPGEEPFSAEIEVISKTKNVKEAIFRAFPQGDKLHVSPEHLRIEGATINFSITLKAKVLIKQ